METKNNSVYLVKNNQSDYAILLPQKPLGTEIVASEILNKYLEISTGVTLPVVYEGDSVVTKFVSIGKTNALKAANLSNKHGKGGYTATCYNKNLYIFGQDYSSTVWGVQGFLERATGYKFFTNDEIAIDKLNDIDIFNYDFSETPTILNRSSGFAYCSHAAPDYLTYAIGLKAYGGYGVRPDGTNFWGTWNKNMSCHNHLIFLPLYKYYDSHPEWYNDKKNQLCLTNMELRDELFKNLIVYFENNPDTTHFLLGHEDNADICRCKACSERISEVGTGGIHMEFINDIARRTEKWRKEHCPDREINVGMFAYTTLTSLVPPVKRVDGQIVPISDSVVAEPNVFILFAPIGAKDHSKPITAPENFFFYQCFEYWNKICQRLGVWLYFGSFRRSLEFTDGIYTFKENIKALKKIGCEFFFVEQNSGIGSLALQKLHLYVLTQLEWNVNQDTDDLINDFMQGYYKCAGNYMREFFDYLFNYFTKMRTVTEKLSGRKFYYGMCENDIPPDCFWSMEAIYDLTIILEKAVKSIDDSDYSDEIKSKLYDRVELEKLFVLYIQLEYFVKLTIPYDEARVINAYTKEQATKILLEFEKGAKKFNIKRVDGDGLLEATINKWKNEIENSARAWEDRKILHYKKIDELQKSYEK